MKNIIKILFIVVISISLQSCDWLKSLVEDDKPKDPNEIKGETNIPINQVGNKFTSSVKVGTQYVNLNEEIKITKNESGLLTISIKADPTGSSKIQEYVNKIPATITDASGKINTTFQVKSTSEGIQDFFNKDGKQHTLVKYDANVGDKYQITKSDGKTITRTVTQKSSTDDFPYGFMNIKVVTVEQDSRIPGVKKIVYKANHKFGLVHVEVFLEDGSTASSYVYTQNY